ncbi:MAG: MSCRAMM family protein, partial [Polyangiaceae bacterium]
GMGGPSVSETVGVIAGQPTNVVLRFLPGSMITGRVLQAGAPQPRTRVMLVPAAGTAGAQGGQTDQDGIFSFSDVPPGTYQLHAMNAVESVIVADKDVQQDVIVPTGVFLGTVADAQSGQPVRGAQVILFVPAAAPAAGAAAAAPSPLDQVSGRAMTGGDGAFRMSGVATGAYSVRISAQNFATRAVAGITVQPTADGADPRPIAFTLDEGGTLLGVAVDRGGSPVAGARVGAIDLSIGLVAGGRRAAPGAVSGSDGTFTLRSLAAGRYELTATAEGFAPSAVTIDFDGTSLQATLPMERGGTLTVRVVGQAGQPVPGATVALGVVPAGSAPVPSVTTDQDGLARYANLVAGAYQGTVVVNGVPPVSAAVTASVVEGGAASATATLPVA